MNEKPLICWDCQHRIVCGKWYEEWEEKKDRCCFCWIKSCRELISEECRLVERARKKLELWEAKQYNCFCQELKKAKSEKYGYTWGEKCGVRITPASKKGVIKNRNDARFWGLEIEERILCGDCLKQYRDLMPKRKKYTFTDYEKRGYWSR